MRRLIVGLCLALAATAAGAQSAQGIASEWRIEVEGDADSDGRIMLELSPEIGTPIRASAQIADGRTGSEMAVSLRDALQLAAGTRYEVEVDGDALVLRKRANERDFVLGMVENTVQGVRIEIAAD